jgi:hypothetical protein
MLSIYWCGADEFILHGCRQTHGHVKRPSCQLPGQRPVCQHWPASTSWRHVGQCTKHCSSSFRTGNCCCSMCLQPCRGLQTSPRHPAARRDSGSTMVSRTMIIQTVTAAVSCGLGLGATPCKRGLSAECWLVCCSSRLRPILRPGQ